MERRTAGKLAKGVSICALIARRDVIDANMFYASGSPYFLGRHAGSLCFAYTTLLLCSHTLPSDTPFFPLGLNGALVIDDIRQDQMGDAKEVVEQQLVVF